ncbi:mucin-3B-like [Lineus longissimus]|uniref:mucin-3B-like n=1 Tax=Lineus longissimus TaxID=88925 RepID=UPI00315CD200
MDTRVALFVVALSQIVSGVKPGKPTLTVSPDPATVDAGITVTFTCAKNSADSADPTSWAFKIGSTPQTTGVAGAIFTYVAVVGDNSKSVTCTSSDSGNTASDPSDGKTLGITAVPAPTLTSDIAETNTKVRVINGSPVKFTCTKAGTAKQNPVSFKFYSTSGGTTTEITSSTAGAAIAAGPPAVLTVTASSTWDGKVIKCEHYNTATSKTDSTKTFTLAISPRKPTLTVNPNPATVDAGITVKFTCAKNPADSNPTSWAFKIGTAVQTTGVAGATFDYVTVVGDNSKSVTCTASYGSTPSDPSDGKTLGITAVPAPTLTSDIVETNTKVRVINGSPVKFTCTKAGTAKQNPVSFKFYSTSGGTTTEITSSTAGAAIAAGPPAVLTVTASSTWDGKVIKCEHYNTATSKTDSTKTFTLAISPRKPTLTVNPNPATVDAGITVTFTCAKNPADSNPTSWAFKIDTAVQTTGVAGATFDYVAVLGDNSKSVTCTASYGSTPSDPSDGKTLGITAVSAPTLTCDITESNGMVTVKNGFSVNFTCTKAGTAKQNPVSFKFYSTGTEIMDSMTGAAIAAGPPAVLTVTASSAWDKKIIKCNHYNADATGSKKDSTNTFTLAVTMVPNPPTISFTNNLVDGDVLNLTCAIVGKIVVTKFELYESGKKLTTGITSSTGSLMDRYSAKVSKGTHNGTIYKCRAENSDGFSKNSTEKTLNVKAGGGAAIVSSATVALVLVLGAVFKE